MVVLAMDYILATSSLTVSQSQTHIPDYLILSILMPIYHLNLFSPSLLLFPKSDNCHLSNFHSCSANTPAIRIDHLLSHFWTSAKIILIKYSPVSAFNTSIDILSSWSTEVIDVACSLCSDSVLFSNFYFPIVSLYPQERRAWFSFSPLARLSAGFGPAIYFLCSKHWSSHFIYLAFTPIQVSV